MARPGALPSRFRRTLPGALLWRGLAYAPSFSGRARRRDFFLVLILSLLGFVLLAPLTMFVPRQFILLDLLALFALAGLPILAATVRRLHDINRHATSLLIAFFPYVGWLVLAFFMIVEGNKHDNVFGPSPRP